jgi:hypothetical protein
MCLCPCAGGGASVRVTATRRRQRPCPVHHHRSQGGGLGGGNVPPLLSPIPLFDFVPLSLLTTWSSPRFSFSCVYVCVCSCDYDGGSGGGAAHPSSFTVGPNLEEILHLLPSNPIFQLEPPGRCPRAVTRQTFLKSERLKNPSFPSFNSIPIFRTRVCAVLGVSVDPCCPVQRHPAHADQQQPCAIPKF